MRFDPADGSKPTQSTVKTGTLTTPPKKNPARDGFRFDGWTHDGQPFDFQTPILQDTTLKAKWTKITDWTLNPDHGPASGARLTINPPNQQEPYYVSVQAAGDQVVSLTGDGRIYTWTKDSTPVQVPFPAQAPDGFHYLQATAGSQRQAALGSDQHIYTWTSQQSTPAILGTGQDAVFTSISINDDRLLAVDRQGQVHAFQASQKDSQNQNPKIMEQAETSLPGKAHAVTAAASSTRILIVDADGQAWIWNATNSGKAKTARIKQDPGTRIVQAQALNQGFLLLDADGQGRYLPDSSIAMIEVKLQNGVHTSQISSNKNQGIITGTDGSLWAWKPGSMPIRLDNGIYSYIQAVTAGSRITALDRRGDMFAWSLDEQGQPDKPARLDTAQELTLESASLDGQPLKFYKTDDSWQSEIPVRKPGPATILVTGRQDSQPFTRSFEYTVDQPLTRNAQQGPTYQVTFDAGEGGPHPGAQSVPSPYGRVKRPSPDPVCEGYLFDGWFIGEVAYDFSKPVTKDLVLTAKWTPESLNNKWSISPDRGSQLGKESTTINPPDTNRDIRFSQISGSKYSGGISYGFSLAVGSDGNAYAWGNNQYNQLGDGTRTTQTTPVMVRKPTGASADFTYVQVSAGRWHSLALGSDGNVYAWGDNRYGQLGDGTTTSQTTAVRVKTPDRDTYPDLPEDFTYVQVSTGEFHSLALGSDGYAYAWGRNNYSQLGNNTTSSNANPVPVRVHSPDNRTDASKGLQATQVNAGYNHSLAIGSDGNAYAWGYNYYGQLGNGTTTRRSIPIPVRKPTDASADFTYVQVSAGYNHSLAIGSDGNAYAWGYNYSGQLGNGTGAQTTTPVTVRKPTGASADFTYVQVSAGGDHSLALGSDGHAYAWGYNNYGQLGNNTSGSSSSVPVRVRDPANPTDKSKGLKAKQISGGELHSLAIGADGNADAWGLNDSGRLGDGTTNNKSAPVPVSFNLQLVITGVRFDQTAVSGLTRGDGNSVTVLTPAHAPGTVTVSVDYTLGGASQTPDTSLQYTYLPAGVLPRAGGEGILLALATGMTGMGGVLASRRHRKETNQLLHASHE